MLWSFRIVRQMMASYWGDCVEWKHLNCMLEKDLQ